jgi:hypothetical protein
MLCMSLFISPAYANTSDWEIAESEDAAATAEQPEPVSAATPPAVSAETDGNGESAAVPATSAALTPDGNLNLVDDVSGEQSESKQFITVTTKTGEYFYIVIDRAGGAENVYFLNLVDDSDLTALLGEEAVTEAVSESAVAAREATAPAVSIAADDKTPEPEKPAIPGAAIGLAALLAIGGIAFYFIKVRGRKQRVRPDEDFTDLSEFDFPDDEPDDDYAGGTPYSYAYDGQDEELPEYDENDEMPDELSEHESGPSDGGRETQEDEPERSDNEPGPEDDGGETSDGGDGQPEYEPEASGAGREPSEYGGETSEYESVLSDDEHGTEEHGETGPDEMKEANE